MTAATTAFHLRPPQGWLNDPNGMTRRNGRWHVFYQHNPDAPVHASISWAHASSEDLAAWVDHGVAFRPTPGAPDQAGCWSGCFVAGLSAPMMAYTGVANTAADATVCIRWGSDDLLTWGEPVVVAPTPTEQGIREMRDPFVFHHAGRRWSLMGASLVGARPAVLLFNADDPLAWTYEGIFAAHDDPGLSEVPESDVWECPQLVDFGEHSALVLSAQLNSHLGDVVAATGVVDTVAGRPRFVASSAKLIDEGTDFYAPQVVNCDDGDPWLMGWVRQDNQDPSVRDHAGCMTLPRRLRIRAGLVTSYVDEVAAGALTPTSQLLAAGEHRLADAHARITVEKGTAALSHPSLGSHALASNDQVWVDGPVVELYPADGVPSTWRHDDPWTLTLAEGCRASQSEVTHSIP